MPSVRNTIHRKTILVATQNKKKLSEITDILENVPGILLRDAGTFPFLPIVEEDGETFRENAIKKATTLAIACNTWAMADDSGLEIDALNGRPGVFSSRYSGADATDEKNIEKVLSELKGVPEGKRTARFICFIALASPRQLFFTVEGSCEGFITCKARGKGGFGYDPIFCVPDYNQTFAELSELNPLIKNSISHRAKALKQFRERIIHLIQEF